MRKNTGQTLVEVLIAMALASLVLPALLTGLVASREGKAQQIQRVQSTALLREASEAVRAVRAKGWDDFAQEGVYYPAITPSGWELAGGTEQIDGFTRSIQLSRIRRDPTGQIVSSGGVIDPSTIQADITVSWSTPYASSVTSSMLFTRYLDNDVLSQTTEEDFNQGSPDNTVVTSLNGGSVILTAGTLPDWCAPSLQITPLDLPKSGVANAISAIEGKVFAGTGENASGVSYATVDISNDKPPVAGLVNTFDGYKTNTTFGEENFAYLGTDNNAKEVVIIDISGSTPSEVGYFNSPGPGRGMGIFVQGNTAFMTDGSNFYSFDVTSKTGSRPKLGSVALAGTGGKVVVLGNYAYVVIQSTSVQMQIIDISNPASLSVVGQAAVSSQAGRDLYVREDGERVYLASAVSATQPEFFIVDTSSKTGSRPVIGSYDSGAMNPRGLTVVPGNKAILVGAGGEEYQVINMTYETAPVRCGGIQIDTGVNGVASVREADGDAYSYIITGDANSELKIIEGFGGGVSTNGSFESATFDAGSAAAFNRFMTTETEPTGTSVTYQIAVAPETAGGCSGATFHFIGPDGTSNSTFNGGTNAIPFIVNNGYTNPGRCFRYKVFLTSNDPSVTPVFSEIEVNYSP